MWIPLYVSQLLLTMSLALEWFMDQVVIYWKKTLVFFLLVG